MKQLLTTSATSYRALISGLLLVFGVVILQEILETPILLLGAGVLILLGIWAAKAVAHHFHGHHHHGGDSAVDALPVSVLILANVLHPAVDGLSLWEVWNGEGAAAGIIFALGIILHEIIRQAAMIEAFKPMRINWKWVVGTAISGIGLGVLLGSANSTFFHEYEFIADLAAVFAYTFIIAEFWFDRQGEGRKSMWFVSIGLLAGILLTLFVGH